MTRASRWPTWATTARWSTRCGRSRTSISSVRRWHRASMRRWTCSVTTARSTSRSSRWIAVGVATCVASCNLENFSLTKTTPLSRERWKQRRHMTTRREKELEELADLLVRTARPYRRIFFRNNWPGPWQCCECGDWIYEPDDLEVHHSDYDGKNNAVENLDPIHP